MIKGVFSGLRATLLLALAAAATAARGQAAFAPAQAYASGGNAPYGLAVGDLNNDGRPDLVTGNYNSSTVGVQLASTIAPGTFAAAVSYATGSASNGTFLVALGDLNADGRLDVVVADATGAQVLVLLGSATTPGALQPVVAYNVASTVGSGTRSLALADVNGDGRLDVAVGGRTTGTVGILLNSATAPGTLGLPTGYSTGGSGGVNIALADLNGDGRPDLVVLDRLQATVRVLLGLAAPAGTFGAPVAYPTQGGNLLDGLVVGDMNADSRPDVLTADSNTSAVSVLLNSATAPGTLLPAVAYGSGGIGAIELTLGDLNNDGRPDVAVSNQFSNTVGVLLASATAPGTLLPATTYAVGGGPRSLVVADLNRDNRRDIAVANFDTNNVSVLLNQMPLGTPPALAAAEVTLYPNPARERCAVQVPAVAGAATVQAELLSALGQVVRRQQAALPAAGATLAVPTAGLPAGMYLLRLAARDAQGATLGALPTQRLAVE